MHKAIHARVSNVFLDSGSRKEEEKIQFDVSRQTHTRTFCQNDEPIAVLE